MLQIEGVGLSMLDLLSWSSVTWLVTANCISLSHNNTVRCLQILHPNEDKGITSSSNVHTRY